MFYFLWAVKNLVNNRRKTIRNILFIMAASSILFLLFSFQRGSVLQHEASLRGNIGDILIGARSGDYTEDVFEKGCKRNSVLLNYWRY